MLHLVPALAPSLALTQKCFPCSSVLSKCQKQGSPLPPGLSLRALQWEYFGCWKHSLVWSTVDRVGGPPARCRGAYSRVLGSSLCKWFFLRTQSLFLPLSQCKRWRKGIKSLINYFSVLFMLKCCGGAEEEVVVYSRVANYNSVYSCIPIHISSIGWRQAELWSVFGQYWVSSLQFFGSQSLTNLRWFPHHQKRKINSFL